MGKKIKWVLAVLCAAILVAVLFFCGDGSALSDGAEGKPGREYVPTNRIAPSSGSRGRGKPLVKRSKKPPIKPNVDEWIKEVDNGDLTPEHRATLDLIQAGLDDDKRAKVVEIVQKLQSTPGWPKSVPVAVRLAAVEALRWFGSYGLAESVGFLADPDDDVIEIARDHFTDAIEDLDLSDRERSELMVMASQVIMDSEAMDSILFELNNMRHSVAVQTIKDLWQKGNKTTQELLPEAIESVTGEDGITSPEKLDEWLKENPDDEGDEEFYGGSATAS